jgi:sulfite exporter TauE/SafE
MIAPLLLGLLGSLGHCVGMCSAVILIFDRQPIFQNKFAWFFAHAGRVTTYSLLGLLAGALGQTLWSFEKLQAILSILFAVIAFYMASAFIGLTPSPEILFSGSIQCWGKAMRGFKSDSLSASYLLGLLWGLLPCGLVLTALVMAMASTNIIQGALIMFIFGLGTIPSLFMVRWLANKMNSRFWPRSFASLVMMFFGFQFAMRGFALLGWVDHLMLGSVMFW